MSHVRPVSVMLIVQGTVDLVAGLGAAGLGLFLRTATPMLADDPEFQQGAPPQEMLQYVTWGYLVIGLLLAAVGALNIYAGVLNWNFKGRTIGFVAMAAGLLTVLSCYCAPTSVAIAVYGLIVYVNPSVAEAFRMREQGYGPGEILATFTQAHPTPPSANA